jgi:predicted nucleotidyltransferase
MYIYAFGSICRGEIDELSDLDLLLIRDKSINIENFDSEKYSIYSEERLNDLWKEGNPFAWHLYLESKLIFSTNTSDYLKELGTPNEYKNVKEDLEKFYNLYLTSVESLINSKNSIVFDLSTIFLSIRNFATCYSISYLDKYNFSRNSALTIIENNLVISQECFSILEKARVLSTRGLGKEITKDEINLVQNELPKINEWFYTIKNKI